MVRAFLSSLLAAASLIVATSCSCAAVVHVRGSTRGHVTFVVDGGRAVQRMTLAERDFSGGWNDIWAISGSSDVREIVYGEAPDGLRAAVAPAPLHASGIFLASVQVEGGGWGGPAGCAGELLFTFTPAGVVRECNDLAACLAIAGQKPDARR